MHHEHVPSVIIHSSGRVWRQRVNLQHLRITVLLSAAVGICAPETFAQAFLGWWALKCQTIGERVRVRSLGLVRIRNYEIEKDAGPKRVLSRSAYFPFGCITTRIGSHQK